MHHLHRPPVYFLLTTAAGFGLGSFLSLPFHFPEGVWIFSLVISLLGLIVAAGAILQFKLKRTSMQPFHESTTLVKGGIYRLTRNPMYLGLLFAQIALLTAFSEPLSLLTVPVLGWIIHTRFVLPEEQMLREKFGEHYQDFLHRTRRWL